MLDMETGDAQRKEGPPAEPRGAECSPLLCELLL